MAEFDEMTGEEMVDPEAMAGAGNDIDFDVATDEPEGLFPEDGHADIAEELPEDIPEKFHGKSLEEIIAMYRNLEGDYTRKAQALREYERQLAEAYAEPEGYEDVPDDVAAYDAEPGLDDTQLEQFRPIAEMEYDRLLQMGYEASPETQMLAWQYAEQQGSVIQQAIEAGTQARMAPVLQMVAPQMIAQDVSSMVAEEIAHLGVNPDEVTAYIAAKGIPAEVWAMAPVEERAQVLRTQVLPAFIYERAILSGNPMAERAPEQTPPWTIGTGHPASTSASSPKFEAQVSRIMSTMGLDRKAAIDILKG